VILTFLPPPLKKIGDVIGVPFSLAVMLFYPRKKIPALGSPYGCMATEIKFFGGGSFEIALLVRSIFFCKPVVHPLK